MKRFIPQDPNDVENWKGLWKYGWDKRFGGFYAIPRPKYERGWNGEWPINQDFSYIKEEDIPFL